MTISIESLLAARLFLSPKLLGNRLFFLSNLGQGGHLSLYAMDAGGSVPEPLLPVRIAVPNPGPDDEPERLIPFVTAYVDDVDLKARRITVDWGLDY